MNRADVQRIHKNGPRESGPPKISDSVSLKRFLGILLFLPDNMGMEVGQMPQLVNEAMGSQAASSH